MDDHRRKGLVTQDSPVTFTFGPSPEEVKRLRRLVEEIKAKRTLNEDRRTD